MRQRRRESRPRLGHCRWIPAVAIALAGMTNTLLQLLSCDQRIGVPSATRVAGHLLRGFRRVHPRPRDTYQRCVIHSAARAVGHPRAHAQFLPDSRSPRVSAHKNGTRVPSATAEPLGSRRSPRGSLLEDPLPGPLGLTARGLPSGTRASAISVPCAHFGIRHSPPAPHRRIDVGRLIRSTEAAGSYARHCCSTPDGDRTGPPGSQPPNFEGFLPGAGSCRVRCWIQTPRRWQQRAQDSRGHMLRG
jgi:hypothetical protein